LVTAKREWTYIVHDTPVYAENTVEYVGEPILMVIGLDFKYFPISADL